MPQQRLQARIEAAKREVSAAERELRRLTQPQEASRDDAVAVARHKLSSARELVAELNALLAGTEFDQAAAAVADAERNLTMVLDTLLTPTRTTIATDVVLEALHRLDAAKVHLGEIRSE